MWLALAAICGSAAIGCGGGRGDQQAGRGVAAGGATGARTQRRPPRRRFRGRCSDAFGDPLTLNAPPKRIVSQTLGTDEILFAICPRDRIAGISELALNNTYSKIVDEAKASGIKTIYGPEDILALKPDLVFIASYSRAEMSTLLRAARAPVYRFSNFDRIEDIANNVRQLGYLIGEDAAAARVVADMNERLTRARARAAASGRRPRIMTVRRLRLHRRQQHVVRRCDSAGGRSERVGRTRREGIRAGEWRADPRMAARIPDLRREAW